MFSERSLSDEEEIALNFQLSKLYEWAVADPVQDTSLNLLSTPL